MEAAIVMTRWMFPYILCMSGVALAAGIPQYLEALHGAGRDAGAAEPQRHRHRLGRKAVL